MRKIHLLGVLIFIILISGCIEKKESIRKELPKDYILEKSEGICKTNSDCYYAGEGCGGGHGLCTNNPKKYERAITTCDINPLHPINRGYFCECIQVLGKCGWAQRDSEEIVRN